MTTAPGATPRIMVVHAIAASIAPTHAAFRDGWSEARVHDLLDSSLSSDLAAEGGVPSARMIRRFEALVRYAAEAGPEGATADGILFTGSAFGGAIDELGPRLGLPMLKPNEAAFAEAAAEGGRSVLLATYLPGLATMAAEFEAAARGSNLEIEARAVEGAFAALQAGDAAAHDALILDAVARAGEATTIVLGQFSMAHLAAAARRRSAAKVLTTPAAAVAALKARVGGRG